MTMPCQCPTSQQISRPDRQIKIRDALEPKVQPPDAQFLHIGGSLQFSAHLRDEAQLGFDILKFQREIA